MTAKGDRPNHRGKKPQSTGGGGDNGGVPRPRSQVQALTDECEQLMLYGVGRTGIARALGKTVEAMDAATEGRLPDPDPEPMPLATADDYIRRVHDRWEAEPLPDWREAQRRQIRRIEGQIRNLVGTGRHAEIEKRERLLARLQGTEATSKVELSGPDGAPLPAPPAAVKVVVMVPENGRLKMEPDE